MSQAAISLLCSGFGLGLYIPGLFLRERFRSLGVEAIVEVFESLLPPPTIERVERNRQACHASFSFALAAQKTPGDIRRNWDMAAVEGLLKRWLEQHRTHFIVLSGHWGYVLDLYRRKVKDTAIHVHLLHVDADLSPSWKQLRKNEPHIEKVWRHVCLFDIGEQQLKYFIAPNQEPPLSYADRNGRIVVHGGGWGMGTYQARIPEIEACGYNLDIACYGERPEGHIKDPARRYFMDDPLWRTWHRDDRGEHSFPPFADVTRNAPSAIRFRPQSGSHGMFRLAKHGVAVASKPGAGTLIDCFATATPIVMLEPLGPHEQANAAIWRALGFGIDLQDWAAKGYALATLRDLHFRLLRHRACVTDYALAYCEALC